MPICPICEGSGNQAITVRVFGEPNGETKAIECDLCDGKGEVSIAQLKEHEAQKALWCSCGNPSNETDFFDDGEHPNCSKHCHTCMDCGKIVQVG